MSEQKSEKRLTAEQVLKGLLDMNIGDYVYDIREREAKGWFGPKVTRYSNLIKTAEELTNEM